MEGVGSRLGRASSRYGPSSTTASTTAFNGPVRKWKKRWVHVSPSPSSTYKTSKSTTTTTTNINNNNNNNNNNSSSRLLLCRWTPLSSSSAPATAASGGASSAEDAPKRKFRYTPIVVIEEQRKAAKKDEIEPKVNSGSNQFTAWQTSNNDDLNSVRTFKKDVEDARMRNLDLGLSLKGHGEEESS